MKNIMPPRFQMGADFYDNTLIESYQKLAYPEKWMAESRGYTPENAYVISHPTWFMEPLPPIPDISIYELFHRTAQRHADQTAVIFLDKKISYRDLDDLIRRYAAVLRDLGIGKGDMVATMLPNSLQHLVSFYAVTMIGAVHTPVDVMFQPDEAAYQVRDSGARTIFILDILYDKVEKLRSTGLVDHMIVTNVRDWANPDMIIPDSLKYFWDTPKEKIPGTIDFFTAIEKTAPLKQPETVDPRKDMALLLYTMATTGKPLGVIETHFNLVFNSLTHAHAFRSWEGREINFSIMPMFHTSGYLLHQLPALYQGGTVIPIPIFDLEDAFRIIKTYGVNVIFAPPTFFIALMSRPDMIDLYDLSSIRASVGCAAPVPEEVQKQWKDLTGIPLINGWGMTETNSGGIISIPGIKEKDDAIGIPVYSEVKITDPEGDIVARDMEGEICYRGLQVAAGYYNKAKETEAAFMPDGWLRTGDRGFIDKNDFVHFVDRIKDLIVASGYNISPMEIENVLYLHPAVEEVAVVSHPDPYRGETVKAVISLKVDYIGKITEQDIKDFCKQHLATYKIPKIIDFRDLLPKSPVGKLMRHELKDF